MGTGIQVNDRTYDAGRAEIRFGVTAAPLQKISFGDKLTKEKARRIGEQEIAAITEGEYDTEDVAVTVEQSIWNDVLLANLPANGYGNFEFPITVYLSDEKLRPIKIELLKCTISGVKDSIEATAGVLVAELTLTTKQVRRNGKTLNRVKGAGALSAAFTL